MPKVTVEAEVEIEVWCSCGEGLCRQSDGGIGRVTVEPCRSCLENARQEGYDEAEEKLSE
jgi:hypothetical protein